MINNIKLTEQEQCLEGQMRSHLNVLIGNTKDKQIPFHEYMHHVLYAPNLGYYSNSKITIGQHGDFTTAPQMCPYFGSAIANFISKSKFINSNEITILEFGAGTGQLCLSILNFLKTQNELPKQYLILEVSPYLKAQQYALLSEHLGDYIDNIKWIEDFPKEPIVGFILANEIFDAMPVSLFKMTNDCILEGFVNQNLNLVFAPPTTQSLLPACQHVIQDLKEPLADGYVSEINLNIPHFMEKLAECLAQGVFVTFDYGFGRNTYYHPQRNEGTLQCHLHHHHFSDFFAHPGISDLTAHVDFTHIIETATNVGFEPFHYANMSSTLIDMGILQFAQNPTPRESQALNLLLAPHEMGELFKAMILTKKLDQETLLPMDHNLFYQL